MKRKSFKLILLITIIIQVILAIICSIEIISIIQKSGTGIISGLLMTAIFIFMVLSILISIFFYFDQSTKVENKTSAEINTTLISEIKAKKEQNQLKEEERQRIQMLNEKKKLLINDLMKDLDTNLSLQSYTEKALINISKQFSIMHALFFVKDKNDKKYKKAGAYAFFSEEELREFTEDTGLSGQVATNKKLLNISNIPDKYITVLSGLGQSSPANLVIFPVLHNDESIGIIELASFVKIDSFSEEILMEYSLLLGNHIAEICSSNLSV